MRLNHQQRVEARRNILHGCSLLLANPGAVHYTQGPGRWEGINRHLRVVRNQRPSHGDCSSTATWLLWNALTHALRHYNIEDVVNGDNWRGGYTGTMVEHGKHIDHLQFVGDCAFYGRAPTYEHVTVYLGNGYVFSHGGEAGPYKLRPDYRPISTRRRYILAPGD